MIKLIERLAQGDGAAGRGVKIEADQERKVSQQKTAVPFDLKEGIRKCFNQLELFEQTVDSFFEEAEPIIKQIHAAAAKADGAEVGRLAHRLRGTVTYLAAEPAADAAGRVEEIGTSGRMGDAQTAISELEHELTRLKTALEEYRSKKKP